MKEVSPGRNRGIYLLGHLASVNDIFEEKPKADSGVCHIIVDNSLKLATNMVSYRLQDLMYGKYTEINRDHSINKNSIK